MSYQVGSACFETLREAAQATCSAWVPVSSIDTVAGKVRTVSCNSPATTDGWLSLYSAEASLTGSGSPSGYLTNMPVAYPLCNQQPYIDASQTVFGSVLTLLAVCYGVWRIIHWVNTGARNQE